MNLRLFALAVLMVPFLSACLGQGDSENSDPATPAPTDTFTTTNISKDWISGCVAGTEPITGDDHYKIDLSLSADGRFSSKMYWYAGTCSPVNYSTIYTVYGTWALSGYNTGSTTTKTITFTIDFVTQGKPDLMTYSNAVRTAFNNNCGGTSPFFGGANSTNGGHVDTHLMTCMSEKFPNTGARNAFSNIATFDGTVLTLGAHGDANIPGTFPGDTLPATATVPLY
jgi:hypothetical protein